MSSDTRIINTIYIRTEVFIVVKFHTVALRVLTQCSVMGVYEGLEKAYCFLPHSRSPLY